VRDNGLYERQDSLGLQAPSVTIVGAGGVGCWVALALALGGCDYISIYDSDEISLHNLNRFPLGPESVGQPKSEALARWLQALRPGIEIDARGRFDSKLHAIRTEWVVCCTDSLKSRKMVYECAREAGAKYLELGADGERWTLGNSPPEFTTQLEEEPGYQSVPVHVGPCMMAGAAAAYYVLHDTVPPGDHLGEWDRGNGRLNIQAYMPPIEDSPMPTLAEMADMRNTLAHVDPAQIGGDREVVITDALEEEGPQWVAPEDLPNQFEAPAGDEVFETQVEQREDQQ
jgi:hypothetical protein